MSQLAPDPAYAFSLRVLQRWATSNLTFTPHPHGDGSGAAVFRFHGSTCGNIEFDLIYHVTVGPTAEGWPILAQRCEPAASHGGHSKMCCWLENEATVRSWMTDDLPISGQPLESALSWEPGKSASGCLCHANGRLHKWNAVLQSLHYHLSPTTEPNFFMKTELAPLNPDAADALLPEKNDRSGVGVHYADAYLKPVRKPIVLPDGTKFSAKRRGLKITLALGPKKGTGLLRQFEKGPDPVVLLAGALTEAGAELGANLIVEDDKFWLEQESSE